MLGKKKQLVETITMSVGLYPAPALSALFSVNVCLSAGWTCNSSLHRAARATARLENHTRALLPPAASTLGLLPKPCRCAACAIR